jgi:hypothetical protein
MGDLFLGLLLRTLLMTPLRNSNLLIVGSKLMKVAYEDAFRTTLYKEAAKIPIPRPRKLTKAPKVRTPRLVGNRALPKSHWVNRLSPAKLFLATIPLIHSIFNNSNSTTSFDSSRPASFSGSNVSNQESQWATPTPVTKQDSQLQETPDTYDWSQARRSFNTPWNTRSIMPASDRATYSATLNNIIGSRNSRISDGASLAIPGVTASSNLIEKTKGSLQ